MTVCGLSCPVRVVSLADAAERRARFEARAAAATLPWDYFAACRGLVHGLTYDEEAVERNKGRQLTAGEIGCYASHYSIWREIAERKLRQCIVLEDDTLVDWAFLAALAEVDLAGRGIRYLRLYAKKPAFSRVALRELLPGSRRTVIEFAGYAYGTQAYVVTLEGARAFLRACAVVRRPVDDEMDRSWEHGVRNLCVFPTPVIEEFVTSGIGDVRFSVKRSALYHAPRQRLARWVERQRIRAIKLGMLVGR